MPISRNTGYISVSIPKTDENTATEMAVKIMESLKDSSVGDSSEALKAAAESLKSQLCPVAMMDLPRVPYVKPIKKAKAAPIASTKVGEVSLNGVPPRDAAMVMAIVCNNLKCEPSDLNFKSIKIR